MSVHIHQARDDPFIAGINDLGFRWHYDFSVSPSLLYSVALNDNKAVVDLPASVYINEGAPLDDYCWHALSALLVR